MPFVYFARCNFAASAQFAGVADELSLPGTCVQAVSEEAYTAVVCQHVQEQLGRHTKRVFDSPVLPAAQAYVAAVPLEFLRLLVPQV